MSKHKPICYDIDISYCGSIHCKLPHHAEDCDHVLLEDTRVFRRNRFQWERVETPTQFYFFDTKNKQVLLVDTEEHSMTKAKVEGNFLECNSRTLYKVVKECWKSSCSLKDTHSILKLSTVTTEKSIIITPLSCELDLHSKSGFTKKDITLGYKAIELDVSKLQKGETKTLIYKVEKNCEGDILLVNHIIARLPNEGGTVRSSCGPLLGTEEIKKGDIVRSEYSPEKINVTKLKTGGTITNIDFAPTTNSNTSASAVVSDSYGNTYVSGFLINDTIRFGDYKIDATGTTKGYIAKRSPNKKWLWVAEGTNYVILGMTTDGTNIYTFGNKNAGQLLTLGTTTYQYIENTNADGAVVAQLNANGNWIWAQMYYATSVSVVAKDISTDAQGYLYVAGSSKSNGVGSEIKLTNSGIVSPTPSVGNIENLFVGKLKASDGSGFFTTIMEGDNSGSLSTARAYSIATDSSGVSYIGGIVEGKAVGKDATGGGSTISLVSGWLQDALLASIDNDGIWRWVNVMTSTVLNDGLDSAIRGVDVNNAGNIYVTGYFRMADFILGNNFKMTNPTNNGIIAFVASYNQDGGFGWGVQTHHLGDGGYSSIIADSKGNVYVLYGENLNGTIKLGDEIILTDQNPIVAKVANGQWIWAKDVTGFAPYGRSITADEQGQITIYTGTEEGTYAIDISDDYIERLKGIAQSNGDTTTQLSVVWTSNIVDTHQSGLLPGYDYGINDLGDLVLLSPANFKKYPLLQYTGTACSTTHLILKKETEILKNGNNSEDQLVSTIF